MMLGRLSILPLALTVCFAGANAQTLPTDSQIEAGREALGAGNYERAIELLRSVAHANRANAEAHYLLAQAFLGDDRFRAARAEIGKARALDRSNIKFAVAEIEILRASTPPESAISLTDGRRVSLAESLLERDPGNPAALEELGLHHAMNYRWYANFDATKQPLGGGVARKAREEFETSVEFLHRAIDADPARLSAYKELLRLLIEEGEWTAATNLAVSATQAMPSNATSWLLKGLVAQMQNQAERAAPSFEHAIHLMSDERRKSFTDIGLFLSPTDEAAYHADRQGFTASYWAERDPFLLTEVNERQVDHYARMAYCDLWYGGGATPGWETERGKIVLRYGIPWSDASFIGGYSRFDVL
ncbi:MAG: tetratricopeptide repeat protein, partial [Rhodothermales bacterium]